MFSSPATDTVPAGDLPTTSRVRYPRAWLRGDVIAGLTAAAVVIPQAMAYAGVAGLPVQVGLYTALVPMLIYAALGTSRPLSVSTTSTIAVLTAGAVATVAPSGGAAGAIAAASTLALLVGGCLVAAWALRLGFAANFVSDPVLAGFKAGIGAVIVVSQIPKLLGVHVDKGPLLATLQSIVHRAPETSLPVLAVAAATMVLLEGIKRVAARAPAPLIAVAAGIAASGLLRLGDMGVPLIGDVPGGLPRFALADLSLVDRLWPAALGIALMSFTETIAAGRAFAEAGDPAPDADRESLAVGLANVAGSFFHIMPAGGGTSQTAVNRQAGAKSQVAEAVTAGVVLVTLLVLAPLVGLMPQATLAALVVVSVLPLMNPAQFRDIARIRVMECCWALVALAGVLLLGTLQGILLAVVISLLNLLYQANHPPLYAMGRKPGTDIFRPLGADHPGDETFPGLLLLRTEGRMTFASAPRLRERFLRLVAAARPRVIVIDCGAVPDIEFTALRLLTDTEARLRRDGVILCLAALNPEPRRVVERAPLGRTLGRDRMFANLEQAVQAVQAHLSRSGREAR